MLGPREVKGEELERKRAPEKYKEKQRKKQEAVGGDRHMWESNQVLTWEEKERRETACSLWVCVCV